MDSPIALFKSGINNLFSNEVVPDDAAQDALGFITQDGREKLIGGRSLVGADSGTPGFIRGLWYGNCVDGTMVLYRKTETKLQYLLNGTWMDILTGLTSGTEASFANYASLAGQFTFFVTTDGYWKINNANPANPMNMYDPTKNFHGRIFVDKGRTILWDRNDSGSRDRTTIYGSKKDLQTGPYYVTVTNEVEVVGNGATKTYTGTLAMKGLSALANCFGLSVSAATGSPISVSAITNAVNPQVTATAHGLSQGNTVAFTMPTGAGTGTLSVGAQGNRITGSGTAFTTQMNAGVRLYGTAGGHVGEFIGTIKTINSNTDAILQTWMSADVLANMSGWGFTFSTMTQLLNQSFIVASIVDANNFTIKGDSTNYDAYSSGGTVTKSEVLTDNRMGVLSSLGGATGTINYITGAYTFNFVNNVVNTQNVFATYFYENSNNGGLTDFTFSGTRLAGEGFIPPQDKGGDPIMNVLIGQDGAYYSIKQQRAYQLNIGDDDVTVTNQIYYENMGIPSINSGVATQKGIMFLNTSNPDKPEMTLLVKNVVSATLTPSVIFSQFKFSLYDYSDAYFDTYERYIVISCKVMGAAQNNRILLCNASDGTVNVSPYEARMFAKDSVANFYVGSPLQENVYQIFNGFDDLGNPLNAYWMGTGEQYGSLKSRMARWRFIREELKKFRKYHIKGMISLDQAVEVWFSFDDAPFQLMGTVRGRGTYVDSGAGQSIGSNFIGQQQIGGDQLTNVYPYFCELKMANIPKFRKRTVKIVPTGIGYFDFNFLSDYDIMLFENRLPTRFRSKQMVSLDGLSTNE